jgi:pyruvate kinase
MLSEESAVGDYPVASVEMMAKVAADIETRFPFLRSDEDVELTSPSRTADAVARAACHMADSLSAAALITCTSSGSTTRLVAKYRPKTPILGLTPDAETYRALSLVWGVTPLMLESVDNLEGMEHLVLEVASKSGRIRPGDTVVVTAGIPLNVRGRTNLIRVMDVPEAEQPQ